jgi:hypothetical protein
MTEPSFHYSDDDAAKALTSVIGDSRWEAVALAHGFLALLEGQAEEQSARVARERGVPSLKESRELLGRCRREGFLASLKPRTRVGSAENPVTKLFPAAVTEERFLELAGDLCERHPSLSCEDERETGHSLMDFTLQNGTESLPINVKTASTPFQKARDLVGLEPDDCIPIPVYKASGALEALPNLLYVVSVDFTLVATLDRLLPELFSPDERIVWDVLNKHEGARLRTAEDAFVFSMVRRHWDRIRETIVNNPFHAVSARKSIRVLQTKPKRTPGIGLRAWGTGANAEVNVHLSIREDTTPWRDVATRIEERSLSDVIAAINRRRQEWVYDPEI